MSFYTKSDGRGKNSIQLRRFNERRVLQALRRMGAASKADLARYAGLTNAAVGDIVASLADQGLLHLGEKRYVGGRGQPATMIRLNSTGAYSIGVRLDRTAIETVLIDFDGNIMSRISYDMLLPKPKKTLEIVKNDIQKTLGFLKMDQKKRLSGIGLAIPFNLESWLSQLNLSANRFSSWEDFDFAAGVENAVNIHVYSENDGTAAAIAELFYGVGREIDNFLYLFLGPGLGGGLVLNAEIVHGDSGNAADVGLMPVSPSTLPSAPQPKGALDIMLNRGSINSLIRHLQYAGLAIEKKVDLELTIAQEPAPVKEWLDDCVMALTYLIWSARSLLDVPTVVLGADLDGRFAEIMKNRLEVSLAASAPESRTPPNIVLGSFGSDAGAVGAASLPIFYSFSPSKNILTNERDHKFTQRAKVT
jgi:predicted NBD/HSP70 family sugar kinase